MSMWNETFLLNQPILKQFIIVGLTKEISIKILNISYTIAMYISHEMM